MPRYTLRDMFSPTGSDSLREIETNLNRMFKEIYDANPGLTMYQPLKLTVSSGDATIDNWNVTARKLNGMIQEFNSALGLTIVPLKLGDYAYEGISPSLIRQLNTATEIIYGSSEVPPYNGLLSRAGGGILSRSGGFVLSRT